MSTILLVSGDKGGVGKSCLARVLCDSLRHNGKVLAAYDADRRNPQLYRFYGQGSQDPTEGVEMLDFVGSGADKLIEDIMSEKAPYCLVDLPAGSGARMEALERELKLVERVQKSGHKVVVFHVLSRVIDSINALKLTIENFGEGPRYVAVKNGFFGPENSFVRWQSSKTREKFLAIGGTEVFLSDLNDLVFDQIDSRSLTFRQASKSEHLVHAQRWRVEEWLEAADNAIKSLNL
jgi:hypothetical protein